MELRLGLCKSDGGAEIVMVGEALIRSSLEPRRDLMLSAVGIVSRRMAFLAIGLIVAQKERARTGRRRHRKHNEPI